MECGENENQRTGQWKGIAQQANLVHVYVFSFLIQVDENRFKIYFARLTWPVKGRLCMVMAIHGLYSFKPGKILQLSFWFTESNHSWKLASVCSFCSTLISRKVWYKSKMQSIMKQPVSHDACIFERLEGRSKIGRGCEK